MVFQPVSERKGPAWPDVSPVLWISSKYVCIKGYRDVEDLCADGSDPRLRSPTEVGPAGYLI